MTERRTTPDPAAEHDALVSETYRDMARENAPEGLNRAILNTAAHEARPKYSRLRLWTRPAAWAAVVMLSVALLLETNQAPMFDSPAPAIEQDILPRQEAADPGVSAEPGPKAERQQSKSEFSSADVQELSVKDEDLLERAEEMARLREGRNNEPAPAAARQEAAPACDEAARATPESWLECIARLEESGALDTARVEQELLAEVFPDFDAR